MSKEVISWIAIVAVLVVVLAAKTIAELMQHSKSHVVEIGSEAEMFYCPGDPKTHADDRR